MVRRLASRGPSVLVKETTELIDPVDLSGIRFALRLRAPNWRPPAEALVWASRVIVVYELLGRRHRDGRGGRRREGKADREIRRCLKHHLARRIFKLLRLGVDSL